jgi:hypothetical protein
VCEQPAVLANQHNTPSPQSLRLLLSTCIILQEPQHHLWHPCKPFVLLPALASTLPANQLNQQPLLLLSPVLSCPGVKRTHAEPPGPSETHWTALLLLLLSALPAAQPALLPAHTRLPPNTRGRIATTTTTTAAAAAIIAAGPDVHTSLTLTMCPRLLRPC